MMINRAHVGIVGRFAQSMRGFGANLLDFGVVQRAFFVKSHFPDEIISDKCHEREFRENLNDIRNKDKRDIRY